ncbi:MAG: ABC transporter ATP-binding protein [Fervidicoccaceae archaeon]
MDGPILEVRDLTIAYYTFEGVVKAARNVSFSVDAGDTACLVGESGSGKSTVVSAIALSLPPNAIIEKGSIIYSGKDLVSASREEIERIKGREISMIFQDPASAFSPLHTVGEHLFDIASSIRGEDEEKNRDMIIEALRKVRLSDPERILGSYPHQLSGGMLQRVAIAASLLTGSKLLIADEPTTMLDATIQRQILGLLKELVGNEGMTLVMVTHNLNVAREVCRKTVIMYAGIVVEDGETEEIFRKPLHPYTQGLIRAIPRNSHKVEKIKQIPGEPPDLRRVGGGCPFMSRCEHASEECRKLSEYYVVNGRRVFCRLYAG